MREDGFIDAAAMMGEFRSNFFFPRYREGGAGPWQLRALQMMASRGYWGEVYRIDGTVILSRRTESTTQSWMSMLPTELESQEIGLRQARGHTVVLGLGMGWLAANVALRPEVERVTVVERDVDIISLIAENGVFEQLPPAARDKIVLERADALEWRPDRPVDSLQADIWLSLVEDRKLADVARMQANIDATSVYFWGQELEIWRYACRRCHGTPSLDWPMLRDVVEADLRLPLLLPDWPDYPERIAAAAEWWTPKWDGWWR